MIKGETWSLDHTRIFIPFLFLLCCLCVTTCRLDKYDLETFIQISAIDNAWDKFKSMSFSCLFFKLKPFLMQLIFEEFCYLFVILRFFSSLLQVVFRFQKLSLAHHLVFIVGEKFHCVSNPGKSNTKGFTYCERHFDGCNKAKGS